MPPTNRLLTTAPGNVHPAVSAGSSLVSSGVMRVAVALWLVLLVACVQSGTAVVPSTTPANLADEPSIVFQDPSAPDPQSFPEVSAPGGLGAVILPGDADGLVAVFGRLPPLVAGQPRNTRSVQMGPSEYDASYGDAGGGDCSPLRLQARDVSSGEFFPGDWTADVFISWWTLGADWEVK